jgi:hypothetical protein
MLRREITVAYAFALAKSEHNLDGQWILSEATGSAPFCFFVSCADAILISGNILRFIFDAIQFAINS